MEDRAGRSGHFTDSSALGPGPPGTSSDRSDVVPSARDIFLPESEAFGRVKGFVAKPEHGRGWSFGVSLLHPSSCSTFRCRPNRLSILLHNLSNMSNTLTVEKAESLVRLMTDGLVNIVDKTGEFLLKREPSSWHVGQHS